MFAESRTGEITQHFISQALKEVAKIAVLFSLILPVRILPQSAIVLAKDIFRVGISNKHWLRPIAYYFNVTIL